MKLFASRGSTDPAPMSEQDLADWGASIDAMSSVSLNGRVTPDDVIAAGQAAVDVINARRGKS